MKFEVRECILWGQLYEGRLDEARKRIIRMIAKHYGDEDFPRAMMCILVWTETRTHWYKDSNHVDSWEMYPYNFQPDVLYIRVEISDAIGRKAVRVAVASAEQPHEDGGSTVPNPSRAMVPSRTRKAAA